MAETITLTAADGHAFEAYVARPEGKPRGSLVICQEVFGVNDHIRSVTDGFAQEGYLAIAPALFDRQEPGVELSYAGDDLARGRALRTAISWDQAVADIAAAAEAAGEAGKVAVVGFCWGGSLAWLAACRLEIAAAVGYYGGQIHEHRAEQPNCPVMLHFGERDQLIPQEQVAEIAALHPDVQIYSYAAGHGFNCDHRDDYDELCAGLAAERTLAFLEQQVG